ncbi:MAG: hypothetical protein DWQ10_14225 [Calditrichaeota bacterium]|nr:MAG: hypothetical protein DWQ10_14225 [Calditrichota bacterium]
MKKITATFLSLVLLVGNMGLTLATHYCGGHPMESVIILDAEPVGCDMMEMEQDCENTRPAPQAVQQDDCCENTYQSLQLNIENIPLPTQATDVKLSDLTVSYIPLNLQEINSNSNINYSFSHPPSPKQDIPILIQSFLI